MPWSGSPSLCWCSSFTASRGHAGAALPVREDATAEKACKALRVRREYTDGKALEVHRDRKARQDAMGVQAKEAFLASRVKGALLGYKELLVRKAFLVLRDETVGTGETDETVGMVGMVGMVMVACMASGANAAVATITVIAMRVIDSQRKKMKVIRVRVIGLVDEISNVRFATSLHSRIGDPRLRLEDNEILTVRIALHGAYSRISRDSVLRIVPFSDD